MAATEYIKALIAFLEKPSSYAHRPEKVSIRQTHASIVAIAPPYVYKVKKPVDLGFMNFTSLEARKANGLREIELNSRLCQTLYIRLVPVFRSNGELQFEENGEIVEYALQMHQLSDGFFLDQLLQQNLVTTSMLEAVLIRLKDFYANQPEQPSLATYGDIAHIQNNTTENFTALRQYVPDIVRPEALQAVAYYADVFFRKNSSLFEKRIREQHIKDCHGDLHLDHIHIQNGRICIYDCIEFNDRFRYMDVAADIAFLAMDLDFNHRPDLSAYVTGQMAALLNDPDMLRLMDFYIGYRACVRAKVESMQSMETEVPVAARQASQEKATRYMQLAVKYALFGSKPAVLIVCGRIGSGKSTWARQLASVTGSVYFSSDVIRKEQAALPLYTRTDPKKRQQLYTQENTQQVYQVLLQNTLTQIEKGKTVVVDATFSHPHLRAVFTQALEQAQVPYFFMEMQASDDTIKERLARREKHPEVISDARLEDFQQLSQAYQKPEEVASSRLMQVNAELPVEETLTAALCQIIDSTQ